MYPLWRLNLSSDRFNKDRKNGKKFTFKRDLEVELTALTTSLRVNNCISYLLSLDFWKQLRMADGHVTELKWKKRIIKRLQFIEKHSTGHVRHCIERTQMKMNDFQTFSICPIPRLILNKVKGTELRFIQFSILGDSMKIICWYW